MCRDLTPGEPLGVVHVVLLLCHTRLPMSRVYTCGGCPPAPSIISWPSPPYRMTCLPPAPNRSLDINHHSRNKNNDDNDNHDDNDDGNIDDALQRMMS